MDWATFYKDYPLLIPAIATVIATVFGYFFVRWNSTHNKNLEIQKKEYDRRAAIYATKIKNARECVDSVHNMLVLFGSITVLIMTSADVPDASRRLLDDIEEGEQIEELFQKIRMQAMAIQVLNDSKIIEWFNSINSYLMPHSMYLSSTMSSILNGTTTRLDRKPLQLFMSSFDNANRLVALMKQRLDELAQTFP
jgi:hypothetical protein